MTGSKKSGFSPKRLGGAGRGSIAMEQPISPSTSRHLPWLLLSGGRIAATVAAAALAWLLTWRLPGDLNLYLHTIAR